MRITNIYLSIALIIIFNTHFSFSQTPSFTWMLGSKIMNQSGDYGAKGVAASTNIPGARENSMSWLDLNGNLWLFGGHGYNASGNQGVMNDLWKYDITNNQWTWISGTSTFNHAGVYGTKGVASASNIPPARQNGNTWVDNSGNLWLFGGQKPGTNSFLNDLWKYDITTNMWTWINGSNTTNQISVYGTQNSPSASNAPGGRFGSCSWTDSNGSFWLFGGQQFTTATERTNDLWKYNITTNQWTWVSGANIADQNGNYGTKGISNSTNVPGARQAALSWTDNSNNLWLYAGYGFPEIGAHSYLNDLWKFNTSTNEWTWVSGSNSTNQPAVYGTQSVASPSNLPGARQMSISWKDLSGDFWLLGGWGYVGPQFGRLNDLWKYSVSNNLWTWMAGANSIDNNGHYGTQGVTSTNNILGARRMSISWSDNIGKLWSFGGNGYDELDSLGLLNDFWLMDVGVTTGTHLDDQKEFSETNFYPNPTNNYLCVKGIEPENYVEIIDMMGRKVISLDKFVGNVIDVSMLDNGIYLINITGKNTKVNKSFLKIEP